MRNEILYYSKEFRDLKEMLNNSCKEFAKNIAFVVKHKTGKEVKYEDITYERFGREVNSVGTVLIDKGYKDKRIAIIGKNRYEWVLTYMAVINGVGTVVPLDKGLPEDEIELSIKRAKVEVIFCEKSYLDILRNILDKQETNLKEIICMDETEGFSTIKSLIKDGETLLSNGNKEYIEAEIDLDKMSSIVFTSGTTSLSKAVMLSQKNIISNINDMNKVEKMYDTDTNIAFLPFHHTFGSTGILLFLSNGVKNVFCDGLRHIQENLKEYKVTVFVCVPLLIESIYKKIEAGIEKKGKTKVIKIAKAISNFLLKFGIDIRRKVFKEVLNELGGEIRFVISGASGLDKKVAKGFNDFGILTIQGYGLTETSPVLAAENAKVIRYGSIGYPMPSVEIKIDNPNEEGIGEIIAKGPNVMLRILWR
ncbi:MAG: AMP-binding protein [Clostridia bacterium]|nr:AMP-binding protein [Clostridia bacterium]